MGRRSGVVRLLGRPSTGRLPWQRLAASSTRQPRILQADGCRGSRFLDGSMNPATRQLVHGHGVFLFPSRLGWPQAQAVVSRWWMLRQVMSRTGNAARSPSSRSSARGPSNQQFQQPRTASGAPDNRAHLFTLVAQHSLPVSVPDAVLRRSQTGLASEADYPTFEGFSLSVPSGDNRPLDHPLAVSPMPTHQQQQVPTRWRVYKAAQETRSLATRP